MFSRSNVANYLIRTGREYLRQTREIVPFTGRTEADQALNDIENLPHLYLLGAQMDRGIESHVAWEIPYRIYESLGLKSLEFADFRKPSIEDLVQMFIQNNLHRYPAKMARIFHNTLEHVSHAYEGDATRLWNDQPSSATLIKRFLQFDGMGLRIATRTANGLFRDFKIKLSDSSSLDVTPDLPVRRVFRRTGFINRHASDEELIYSAREMHVRYPGIFEKPSEEIVKRLCKAEDPLCHECPLDTSCLKII